MVKTDYRNVCVLAICFYTNYTMQFAFLGAAYFSYELWQSEPLALLALLLDLFWEEFFVLFWEEEFFVLFWE